MSVRSGHKTSREPLDIYNGYRIIKVTEIEYERSIFDPSRYSSWPKNKEVHFDFCKEGNEKKPSQDYKVCASNVAECKECIDNFIKDDSIYFTAEEREKYVYKPNKKCGWEYGYDSLMKLLKEHQKADKRMKILIEDRLADANFKSERGLLSEGKYDEFIELVRKSYKFREKFEVYTETECKRIKDPQRLEAHIKSAIEEYFKVHKMDVGNTSVNVRFIENW
jgi:hypothetical protein